MSVADVKTRIISPLLPKLEKTDKKGVRAEIAKEGDLQRIGTIGSAIEALSIKYDQKVTLAGVLKSHHFNTIELNGLISPARERAILKTYTNYISSFNPGLENVKGSSTLVEKIENIIFKAVTRVLKGLKGIKIVFRKRGVTLHSEGKARKKTKNAAKKGVAASPLALIRKLNRSLPEAIRGNMGSPRLNYRTGRFSRSARILNITQTNNQFSVVEYTYQHNPYLLFELGNSRLATRQRDPRKIIDMSIREIATKAGFLKFHTKRV